MAKVTSSMSMPSLDAKTAPQEHPQSLTNSTTEDALKVKNNNNTPSAKTKISKIEPSPERSPARSPSSKKRSLPNQSLEDEPISKKSRDSPLASPAEISSSSSPRFPSPPDLPATKLDKETWQGFCDIESEPAYFSVILREMGVRAVTVREVFAMDPAILESLPQPIYGLILLFRFREFGNEDQAIECPADVWFANQLPAQNSCATLAMINILMNSAEVDLGEHLDQFKDFTRDLTPFQRGEALSSFDFLKKIHNSFAKKMDILESDKYLSYKVHKAERLKKEKIEKIPKNDTKSRRDSADSTVTDDSADTYEDNAHHFIAFVPVGNEVWKLDGYDAQPTSIGTFDAAQGETWLSGASDTIAALMAAGDDDYGVIALAQSPLVSLRKKACLTINTTKHVEARLDNLNSDWKSFVLGDEQPASPRMLGIEDDLPLHPVPDIVKAQIDAEHMADLLVRRSDLVEQVAQLSFHILQEIQQEADENKKATQRRHDCGPVIKKWLEMLASNGYLEENLGRFMPAGKGGK